MILARRKFLIGLLAAPIIVRPGILMPVRPLREDIRDAYIFYGIDPWGNLVSETVKVPLFAPPIVYRPFKFIIKIEYTGMT